MYKLLIVAALAGAGNGNVTIDTSLAFSSAERCEAASRDLSAMGGSGKAQRVVLHAKCIDVGPGKDEMAEKMASAMQEMNSKMDSAVLSKHRLERMMNGLPHGDLSSPKEAR